MILYILYRLMCYILRFACYVQYLLFLLHWISIDDENKMLFLYIDFKDDAELNELTEIETQMLRNIFKETHEKYNTGWYNAE